MLLAGRKILLGVCGGIAAYRACDLARTLVREGAEVRVVLTPAAARFVSPLTFSALTGSPALCEEFVDADPASGSVFPHLDLSRDIDCFVIAPATANTMAKLAVGLADNLLTSAYLSCEAPVVIAPAMNVRMWQHPATRINVDQLVIRGVRIVEPESGELACGDTGEGRLAALEEIVAAVIASVPPAEAKDAAAGGPLHGKRFIVTAGGTREYLDPVRYITNASTGRLGLEVARSLSSRGAIVELVDTGIDTGRDATVWIERRHTAKTAFDMLSVLAERMADADGLVMLAAIADYSPAGYEPTKHSKDGMGWQVALTETTDVLATITKSRREGQVFAGVSLEDTNWLEGGMKKAAAKSVDIMLAVELGAELPFGDSKLNCALVTSEKKITKPDRRTKSETAEMLADWLEGHLSQGAGE